MSVARYTRRFGPYHGIAPIALAAALAFLPAACGGESAPGSDGAPSDAEGNGGNSPSPSAEPIDLPQTVENPPWRGEVTDEADELAIASYNDDVSAEASDIRVAFKSAEATGDGVEFLLHFTWNVTEATGEIYHSQIYAESEGETYTTGEEGVMTSYSTAQGGSEMVIEHTFTLPDAPESGAIFFQGGSYEDDGSGLPPIGVCYEAGGSFTTQGCT